MRGAEEGWGECAGSRDARVRDARGGALSRRARGGLERADGRALGSRGAVRCRDGRAAGSSGQSGLYAGTQTAECAATGW